MVSPRQSIVSLSDGTDSKQDTSEKHQHQQQHTFDEALELAGFGRAQIFLTFLSGCSLTAAMNEAMGVSFILSAGHCDLGLSAAEVGMVGGAIFLGIMVSSYFWGYQADTRGRQVVLKFALFATSACSVASCFATGFITLVTLRFMTGLCVSASSAIAYTYLGEFCTNQKRGQMIGYASSMITLGVVYAAFIGWWILSFNWRIDITDSLSFRPWRLLFLIYTTPGLLAGIAYCFLPESPKFLLSQGRPAEALKVLQKLHEINKVKSNYPVTSLILETEHIQSSDDKKWSDVFQSLKAQTVPLFRKPLLLRFAISTANSIITFAIYVSLCLWFPQIMNQVLSGSSANSTGVCTVLQSIESSDLPSETTSCNETIQEETFFYTMMLGCIGSSCGLALSFILGHVKAKTLMIISTIVAGIAGILLQFVANSYTVAALFCVLIMFPAMGVTLINASSVSLFPTHVLGMAVSLINMMGRFSSFVLSAIIGALIAGNCAVTLYAFSGLLFLSAGLTILLP